MIPLAKTINGFPTAVSKGIAKNMVSSMGPANTAREIGG